MLLAQEDFKSEEELKQKANALFEQEKLVEAKPLFTQLLALYPKDPNYNFKYGACLMASQADKQEAITYLQFAVNSPNVDPLAYYYLGRAHHLNYNFAKAVKAYSRFKTKGNTEDKTKYQIERQIQMCKNGNDLLSRINEVQVLDKQEISESDFFRIYDLKGIDGKIIAKPEDFMSKYDQKIDERSIIYLPPDAKEVYYSSYGKKGENGRDIYKAVKLGNGNWSEPVRLGEGINTPYDENYAFIHPDGRTLYFASKGHSSMGGYDLFMSTFDQTTNEWTEPENLDFAFSSADDDVLFISDEDKSLAFFASNRSNASGRMTVYKVKVKKEPADITIIQGEFIAESNPTNKKAKITVIDPETNQTVGVYETDADGKYQVEFNQRGGVYQFNIETTEDAPIHTGTVNVPDQDEFEVLGQELRLVGEGDNQQLVIKNIFDGTALPRNQSGPRVSSELLRLKANLDVNLDAGEVLAIEQRANSTTSEIDNSDNNQVSEDKPQDQSSADATLLVEKADQIEADLDQKLEQVNKAKNLAYKNAKEQSKSAKEQLANTEANANDQSKSESRNEAERTALSAAYGTSLGNEMARIEKQLQEQKETLSLAKDKAQNNDFQAASQLISQVEATNANTKEPVENLQEKKRSIQNNIQENAEILSDLSEKKVAFEKESERLEIKIDSINVLLEQSDDEAKAELTQQSNDYQLDREDLSYQLKTTENKYNAALANEKALQVELEQVELLEQELNLPNNDVVEEFGESDVQSLNNQISEFKTNNQLAYTDVSSENDNANANLSSGTPPQTSPENFTSINSLNSYYQDQIYKTEAIADGDLKQARKTEIIEDWKAELSKRQVEKENELANQTNERVKQQTRAEIDQIANKIQELDQQSLTIQSDLANNTQQSENQNSSTSTENTFLENSSANLNLSSPIEQDIDVSGVDENSLIPEEYTDLNFKQEFIYGSSNSTLQVRSAKKSLAQAATYSKKAEDTRSAAYGLPTLEARNDAFDKAVAYEQASQQKELESAQYFAQANASEYNKNEALINDADNYGEGFESSNLDIAQLLADEAEVYFNNGLEVRATINPEDRASKQKAELQKAYDYEMLALEKQKQALKILKIVDDEYQTNPEGKTFDLNTVTSVQITEPSIIALNDAAIARQGGDSLTNEINVLEARVEELNRQLVAAPDADEKLKIEAEIETVNSEKTRLTKLVDQYYARATEIEAEQRQEANAMANVLKPASVQENLTTIDLDTVTIEDSRKEIVVQSKAYVDYLNSANQQARAVKNAQSDYALAQDLVEEKIRLQKEAKVIQSQIAQAQDEEQKQQLIKSADIINLKLQATENSIDSISDLIKLNNFVIKQSQQKMNNAISGLTELEKAEIVKIANDNIDPEAIVPDEALADTNLDGNTQTGSGQLDNTETSLGNTQLPNLDNTSDPIQSDQNEDVNVDDANPNNVENQDVQSDDSQTDDNSGTQRLDPIKRSGTPSLSLAEIDRIPNRVTSTIFMKIASTESHYSVNNPIPVDPKMPEGLVYKVQIGAFRNPIPQNLFKGFAPLMAEKTTSGITRYTAGIFVSERDAVIARNEIRTLGYKDAFVVAFLNGKRVSISQARQTDKSASNLADDVRNPSESGSTENSTNNVQRTKTGSTEGLSNRFKTQANIISVKNANTVEGLYYTVQIGVFSKPLSDQKFANYKDLNVKELSGGLIRYNSGIFTNAVDANNLKNQIVAQIPDAFVVAYYKGKRISLNEAARISNQ